MLLEINGRRLRAWVHMNGPRVERLVIFRPDFEAVAHKRQPMSDKVIGYFAVLFRFRRDQVPCNIVSAALAGSALTRTSPVINQLSAEVRRCMTNSPSVLHRLSAQCSRARDGISP